MALELYISSGSAAPIYRQIVEQIRNSVASGIHRPGDPLPSVRTLAARLVINPNTVAKAYAELVRDGVVESRQGRGYFVADGRPIYSDEERSRRLESSLDTFLSEVFVLNYSTEQVREALERRLANYTPRPQPDPDRTGRDQPQGGEHG